MSGREPSEAAKRMVTLAQIGQMAMAENRPPDKDLVRSLRGWAPHVREEHFVTASEVMERAASEIETLTRQLAVARHHVYFCDQFHPDGDLPECPTCGERTLDTPP